MDSSESSHELAIKTALETSINDLDLSVRTFNVLKAAKIDTLSELVQYSREELMRFRNFTPRVIGELEDVLHARGLSFGMMRE